MRERIERYNIILGIGIIAVSLVEVYRLARWGGCAGFIKNIEHCGRYGIFLLILNSVLGGMFLLAGIRGMKGDRRYLGKSHLICKDCETPHNVDDNLKHCLRCGGELVPLEGFYNNKKINNADTREL